jgi:hypothetical protein
MIGAPPGLWLRPVVPRVKQEFDMSHILKPVAAQDVMLAVYGDELVAAVAVGTPGRPVVGSAAAAVKLREAAETGDAAAASAAIESGAPLNGTGPAGWTTLHRAAGRGRVEVVRTMLAAGADPNAAARNGDESALHLAAAAGFPDVVRLLLVAGANPRAKNRLGWTALEEAVLHNHAAVERVFRRFGVFALEERAAIRARGSGLDKGGGC